MREGGCAWRNLCLSHNFSYARLGHRYWTSKFDDGQHPPCQFDFERRAGQRVRRLDVSSLVTLTLRVASLSWRMRRLYGIMLYQTLSYFREYPRDNKVQKCLKERKNGQANGPEAPGLLEPVGDCGKAGHLGSTLGPCREITCLLKALRGALGSSLSGLLQEIFVCPQSQFSCVAAAEPSDLEASDSAAFSS